MQEDKTLTAYSVTEEVWMVPCRINAATNQYEPLSTPYCGDLNLSKLQIRQTWLPEEDSTLQQIILQRGPKAWSLVAKELNKRVHNALPLRQGKQCRERYYNHIDPQLIKGNWTQAEDLFILQKQQEFGNKWSDIARNLRGRTENHIKNRFKSLEKQAANCCPDGRQSIEYLIDQKLREVEGTQVFEVVAPLPLMFPALGFMNALWDQGGLIVPTPSSRSSTDTGSPRSVQFFSEGRKLR